jgi:polyhydroxybutyrate depolymerase
LGIDACNTSAKTVNTLTKYTLTKWLSCNNSAIQIYLTEDGGHSWPGGDKVRAGADAISDAIVANDVIWSFFQQYKLP